MKTNTATLGLLFATIIGVCGQPSVGNAQVPASTEESASIELQGEWSLAERSTWEQIYADRMQYLNLMNSTCGTSITMSFDHDAFRDRLPSVDSNRNEDWNASAMITEIRNLCLEGEMQRAAVAAKIGSIKFVRAPGRRHVRRGKKLVIALDLEANPRQYVNDFSAWLAKSL